MSTNTHFQYEAFVDGSHKVQSGGYPTLDRAISEGMKDATYYKTIYPESTVTISVSEYCHTCSNSGVVRKPGKLYLTKRCPVCKGKIPEFRIDGITLSLAHGVKLIEE